MMTQLLQWLGVVERPAQPDTIDAFLDGATIPQLSAGAGQDMIARQRQIEAEIRQYIYQLEQEISELQNRQ